MKISVIIAAYNAAATLERAIRSVLAQTRQADEIIVVDDGSTDSTADVVRQFGSDVRLISQSNGGVSVARNTGIQNASGDWIAFLDADDEWLREKLRLQDDFLCTHTEIAWGYGNFIPMDRHGKPLDAAHKKNPGREVFDYFEAYCRGFYAWTGTLIVRQDVFSKTGLFEVGMKRAQDNDLWFRIGYHFPQVGYISQPLAIYHLDTPGSSTKVNIHYEFMIQLVQRHLELSKQYGRYEAFVPCVRHMLQVWIRELIQNDCREQAQDLLDRFYMHLPSRFCREIRFRLRFRRVGSALADGFLRVKDSIHGKG